MLRLGERGVAAVTVVIIIVASAGVSAAVPVAIDAADVDPDHPLYGLERLGERIRGVGDFDQMKERFSEFRRLVDKGKGLEYKAILDEFVEKVRASLPENVAPEQEMIRWMREHAPDIGLMQLKLCLQRMHDLKEDLPEEARGRIENLIKECENGMRDWNLAGLRENVRARMRLIREKIENIIERYRENLIEPVIRWVKAYFDIDNVLVDIDITVKVVIDITVLIPVPFTEAEFERELKEFDELLAEVRAMLEGTPENTHSRRVAEEMVETAIKLRDEAVDAYRAGKLEKALGLICTAKAHLQRAKMILLHASEWEPEFRDEWAEWEERWENLKREWIKEGIWDDILENYQRYIENIRHWWREKMRELTFETISEGEFSGHDSRKDYVIKDEREWKNLWDIVHSRVFPKPGLPDIDFDDEMIIAVFQGTQPSSGYSIEIIRIVEEENFIKVFVGERIPPRGAIVLDVLTQPYHIIATRRVDKEILFERYIVER